MSSKYFFSHFFLLALLVNNSFAQNVEDQKLVFDETPGLPASIDLKNTDSKIQSVKLQAVVDGELISIPMSEVGGGFGGIFPTPETSLEYSFIYTFKDGTMNETHKFKANQVCRKGEQEVTTEIRQLLYVNSILEDIGGGVN